MMIKTKPVAPEVALSAIQLTDGKVKNINIMSCQQQKDSTSCGPLCIGYLWALSEGEDPNNFHFVPADIRKNILRLVEDKDQVETVIMGRRTQKVRIVWGQPYLFLNIKFILHDLYEHLFKSY